MHAGDGTSGGLNTVQNLNAGGADSDAPFSLVDGQQLIGEGVPFYGMGGDAFPQLTATGADVISLANRNEVAGLALTDSSGSSLGIAGDNATDFNIHDNRISTAGGGFGITGDVAGRIDNNVIDSGGDGAALANAASADGIGVVNRGQAGGTAEQAFSLAGRDDARVSAALDNAFNGDNTAVDDGVATQDLTVAGVAFRAPGSATPSFADGIDLRNATNGTGAPEAVQTADFSGIAASDGIASVGGDDGVCIANEAFIGRATQSVALAGRGAITGADLGVGITNAGYGTGQAGENVGVIGFAELTGGTAGVGANNVSNGSFAFAIQRLALRELTLPAAAGDGLLFANSAAIQFIDLFTGGSGGGNAVSGSGGAADIVADNSADATSGGDDQRLDLRGNPAITGGSTIAADGEGNQSIEGP